MYRFMIVQRIITVRWPNLYLCKGEGESNNTKILQDSKQETITEYNKVSKQLEDGYRKLMYELQAQVDEKRKDFRDTVQCFEKLKEECDMKLKPQRGLACKELDLWQKYKDNDILEARTEQASRIISSV